MSAHHIAEALAAAERGTPAVHHHHRVVVLNQHGRVSGDSDRLDLSVPQELATHFVREDVAEAALRHLAERLERAEARLEAVSREGWRACGLLAAEKEQLESERAYAEADRAGADGANESAIEELHEQAGASDDEARRLRACVLADDAAREADQ